MSWLIVFVCDSLVRKKAFKDEWKYYYFVLESSSKELCLIYNETVTAIKKRITQNIQEACEQKNGSSQV